MIQDYVIEQRNAVLHFLKSQFNNDISNFQKSSLMLDTIIKTIGSLKIWQKNLESVIIGNSSVYINEIISNLNHSLIMAALGFKTPTMLMIRRSQENLFSFLYYKDHPIELYRKETDLTKKNQQMKMNELKDYIVDYPLIMHYPCINAEEARKTVKRITDVWQEQYKDLSNYVHGTNSNFLELVKLLEDIQPSDELFNMIIENIEIFSSVINSLFIIFYFNEYKQFIGAEKSFIRQSIINGFGFKEKIRFVFQEI
ncbi:hypothetical protein MRBLBA21_001540 [Peribacillus frigoritolerans]|uniref:hypothetical protein n=1 Tax=Peribacillus frigoritolerans TaxID=450367 RepID=UPI003439991D